MTTFTVKIDTEDQYLIKKAIESIYSIKQQLHIPIEINKNEQKFDLDSEIKNLEIIDEDGGNKLGEVLKSLGQGVGADFDFKKSRDEYLLNKHAL